jgi:RNA polymerase sigma factor (TIGR02999 family)
MNDVTRILSAIEQGHPHAAEQLLPLVYDELRHLAALRISQEKPGQTLDATALVHEAYLRLVGDRQFADRHHFFRVAAEAMRRVLIDRARRKQRIKQGGTRQRVPLSDVEPAAEAADEQLLALDAALDRFAAVEPAKAELVKLRYFAGLSEEEAAAALGISRATASRHWAYARAWLINAMEEEPE